MTQSYSEWQKEVHFANTMISSWHNCPCDDCNDRQRDAGLPLAQFARPERPAPVHPVQPVRKWADIQARIEAGLDEDEPPF